METIAVKIIAIYFASSMITVYLAVSLQFCSFALYLPAIVEYINSKMDSNEAVRGQAINSTTTSICTMVGTALGGIILDNMGVKQLLFISAAVTTTGMVAVVLLLRKD